MPQNPRAIFENVEKNNLTTLAISYKCNSFTKVWMILKLGENVFQLVL
jgi:hypothetical protein